MLRRTFLKTLVTLPVALKIGGLAILAKLVNDSKVIVVSGTLKKPAKITFDTCGLWKGDVKMFRKEENGKWEKFRTYSSNYDRNVSLFISEKMKNVSYKFDAPKNCKVFLERA